MRRCAFMFIVLLMQVSSNCQKTIIDSLSNALKAEKADTAKARILYLLSYYYKNKQPDSALLLAETSYKLSKQVHFEKGEATALGLMGGAFNQLGNFTKALEYYLEQLKLVEEKGDAEELANVNLSIALVYNSQRDAVNAIVYARKADSIAKADNLRELSLYTSLDLGDIYTNANQLDSAIAYTKRSYDESVKDKNDLVTGTALNNIGNIYFKSNAFANALNQYKASIPYLLSMEDFNSLAECYLGLAKSFDQLAKEDSALFYANEAYRLGNQNQFLNHAMNASAFLAVLYRKRNRLDSAFAYQYTYIQYKDSFDNGEKIRALQSLTLSEQLRQQQLAEEKLEESRERKEKLQLLLIAVFIPILFFISLYVSRKKVKRKVVQLLGILSLLFFFEYITLLLHPVVSYSAQHSPIIELIIFVVIASIILPLHHKIEHWLISKLTHRHEQHLAHLEALAKEQKEVAK